MRALDPPLIVSTPWGDALSYASESGLVELPSASTRGGIAGVHVENHSEGSGCIAGTSIVICCSSGAATTFVGVQ